MCDEEKMAMRANARARLSAALNNPADGLVLARWEDYQRKVNLKEELVLIPNIKDFKTMATQITDINFNDARYPKLLKETLEQFETNESNEIISCFRQKKINVAGETGTIWQKYIRQGVVLQRTHFCIFKTLIRGTNWVEKNIIDDAVQTEYVYVIYVTRLKSSLTKQVIVRVPALESRVRRTLPGRRIAHLGLPFGDYRSFFHGQSFFDLKVRVFRICEKTYA